MSKPVDGFEEIGFTYTLKILWKRKFLVLAGTLLVTVASLIYWLSVPNVYESESYIDAYYPGRVGAAAKSKGDRLEFRMYMMWSGDILKRLNKKNFLLFLKANRAKHDPDGKLAAIATHRLALTVDPVFLYKSIRNRSQEQNNFVTEFRLIVSAGDSRTAVTVNRLLREFVATYVINHRIAGHIKAEYEQNDLRINNHVGFLGNQESALEIRNKRRNVLLKTNRRFAPLNNPDISVDQVGEVETFRTPLQRLMELEINIANTRINITETKKTLDFLRFKKELYTAFREMAEEDGMIFRPTLLDRAVKILADFREQHPGAKTGSREQFLDVENYLYQHRIYRENTFKFSVEPPHAAILLYPKTGWNVLLAFVLSLLLFSVAAFILETWQRDRAT